MFRLSSERASAVPGDTAILVRIWRKYSNYSGAKMNQASAQYETAYDFLTRTPPSVAVHVRLCLSLIWRDEWSSSAPSCSLSFGTNFIREKVKRSAGKTKYVAEIADVLGCIYPVRNEHSFRTLSRSLHAEGQPETHKFTVHLHIFVVFTFRREQHEMQSSFVSSSETALQCLSWVEKANISTTRQYSCYLANAVIRVIGF